MNINMNVNQTSNKIDMFIVTTGKKYLPDDKLLLIREKLEDVDIKKIATLQSLHYKNPITFLLISIFLGWFGVDRFMLGQKRLGLCKLICDVVLAIWWIIDWFTAMNRAREYNFDMLIKFIQ